MNFEANGISFQPFIPASYSGNKTLSNFKYRNAILNLEIEGTGNKIKEFKVDGVSQKEFRISGDLSGNHTISIALEKYDLPTEKINIVQNYVSPEYPSVQLKNDKICANNSSGVSKFSLFINGKAAQKSDSAFDVKNEKNFVEYAMASIDENGVSSFISEPIQVIKKAIVVDVEKFATPSTLPYKGFLGKGFVELTKDKNRSLKLEVNVEQSGDYFIDFRYANGSGPVNTDNKCAIRTLSKATQVLGVIVFPQRGSDEWSNWGYSNALKANLSKGKNELILSFETYNENMNGEINSAMLDQMRVIKVD